MAEFENQRAIAVHDPDSRYGADAEAEAPDNPMDSPAAGALFNKLMEWYQQERERQAANRYQMALDEDFYDGLQWSDEDIAELEARGQAAYVYNKVKPTIDWVIGTEKRTRIDFKVLPREEDDVEGAETKTKLLKYLSDVNKTPFHRSRAFSDQVKAGVGWLEDGIRANPEEELLYSRAESWRNMIYDSSSMDRDMKDARFIFRLRWVDLDIAQAYFPDRADVLRQAALGQDLVNTEMDEDFWYLGQHYTARDAKGEAIGRRSFVSDALFYNRRERVKLIECWYRMPVCEKLCRGKGFDGAKFDPNNQAMVAAYRDQAISVVETVRLKVRCAILTEGHMLIDAESPYRHNRFPFTPLWCYRRARDNAPYGLIRNVRDPQEDLNKRASKALFILSTNQIEAEVGASDDWDETRKEAARPDGIVIRNKGTQLEVKRDSVLAEEHLMLMDKDAKMIQDVAGVTDENMGRQTNATSGIAIQARQDQGSVLTAEPFDNLRFALQLQGEIQLSLAEQYVSEAKVLRITGNRGKLEWVKLNQVGEDGEIVNDITRRQADFIIGEQDFRQTLRIAMFETMSEMVGKLPPEIGIQLMDMVVELADAPNKEEMVARIRKINGQRDPDAKMTPEEEKAMKDDKQQKAEAAQMEKRAMIQELDEQQARIGKLNAEAEKIMSEAGGDGGAGAELQARFAEELKAVQEKAAEQIQALAKQITILEIQKANTRQDVDGKFQSETEKARIQADADVEVARINRKADNAIHALTMQIDSLEKALKDVDAKHSQALKDREKSDKERQAERDKTAKEREKSDKETSRQTTFKLDAGDLAGAISEAATGSSKSVEKLADAIVKQSRGLTDAVTGLAKVSGEIKAMQAETIKTVKAPRTTIATDKDGKVIGKAISKPSKDEK